MASGNRKQNVHRSEQQRLGKAVMNEREKAQGLTKADVIDLSGEDEHEVVDNSDRHHKGNIRTEADSIIATPKPQQESHDDTIKENPQNLPSPLLRRSYWGHPSHPFALPSVRHLMSLVIRSQSALAFPLQGNSSVGASPRLL
jgi:hypothetical protein